MLNKEKISKTRYLLPKNNFFTGLESILNISGTFLEYDYSKTEKDADLKALYSDWISVGDDMKVSKRKFENEHRRIIDKIKTH